MPDRKAHSKIQNLKSANPPRLAFVGSGDNDPVRFWRYVITACQKLDPKLGAAALAQLRSAQSPPFEAILTTLINELARLPDQAILVREDYHVITAPQIHEQMTFLIDHLPTLLHVVITTRQDPPLPLAGCAPGRN